MGVDGLPHTHDALEWAVEYARRRRLPLIAVNAAGVPGMHPATDPTQVRQALRMAARRVTDETLLEVRRLAPEVSVTVTMPLLEPHQALLELSDKVSMIVLGSRGRGPVRSNVLGSVGVSLTSAAACPVTVVRPRADGVEMKDGPVVVGVELDGSSSSALPFAFDLASTLHRPLNVVHAWTSAEDFLDVSSTFQRRDALDRHERQLAEELAGFGDRYPDVVVDRLLTDGPAVARLVAASERAGHLVLGSRGRHGIPAMLGSVSKAVLERAHCPVTVVRQVAEVSARVG